MKKQTLTLLTAFLLVASFLPIIAITSEPVQAQPPENTTTRSFGNLDLPDWKDVEVDNSDPKWLEINNADGLVFRFATEKDKFNEIYQDNALIVKDERWLIYFDDKEGGSTAGVEWKRVENYNVKVTQFYDDKQSGSGSSYKVIWDFYGGFRPKVTVELEVATAGHYKIDWRANLYKDYAENMTNYARFWNENDNDAVVFDYSDVYEEFGDITAVENIEGWFKGKRFDLYFDVGHLDVENFRLDPNFGYETAGASYVSLSDVIIGSVFTCPNAGTADNITAYLTRFGGPPPETDVHVKCAIYKHSDLSLIGYTEQKLITTLNWYSFNIVSGGNLEASTEYILFAWGSRYDSYFANLYFSAGDTDQGHGKIRTYNSFPDPFPAPYDHYDSKYSIFCSYTTANVNVPPLITSITCDNTLVDRKLDYPGSTAPKATRIYIKAEDNNGRDGIVLENCRVWIRDNNDTIIIDNLACTGYENIDENTKRFWYDFEPSDALPDENLGAFDVKAQIIDNYGAENTKDYTSLGFELFTVNDLILPAPTVPPTPYRHQRITVSGSVSRVHGTASLDNAWVLDQIEGTLVAEVVGNTYSATYEVTSNLGATVSIHARAFDLGSGLDGISPSVSYTVVSSPTLWVLLSLGAYENEEAPADVDPSLQPGTYVGGEWVPRDWFYPGETCFLRAHVRNAGTNDPVTNARVEMTLVYGNLEFEVRQPESGLYEGSLLLVDIPTDGHTIGVEIYAEGYTNWHGEASFTLIEAPVPPPPVVVPWWQQWWAWLGIGAVVAVAVVFMWRWK